MRFLLLSILTTLAACSHQASIEMAESATFLFLHESENERFVARTQNREVIAAVRAELRKPPRERKLHINGVIAKGNGGINKEWSWHFSESEWSLTELSFEICDAWPSYIEENLETWLEEVGSFCPWASRVEMELNGPPPNTK